MRILTAGILLALTGLAGGATADSPRFDRYWYDGHAELDGYRLGVTRYGQLRQGECVMVFVTEPFSRAHRVKLDDPADHPDDTIGVLKLNLVRDFQTGIYDYNTMLSVFARDDDFAPIKISFSSAEWCGHVYEQLLFDTSHVEQTLLSYFEGESTALTHDRQPGAVTEDNLFILLRGLRGAYMKPGERRSLAFLPGSFHRRLTHRELAWTTADIERRSEPEEVTVPAGVFSTLVYVVTTGDGRVERFQVEDTYPHRIVRWSWRSTVDRGRPLEGTESGELSGTTRLKYWELNDLGDERHRRELGLDAPATDDR